jgi:hypothetical protein
VLPRSRTHLRLRYSVPHPLQAVMHVHVQTLPNSGKTCSDAMMLALKQTGTLCEIMCDLWSVVSLLSRTLMPTLFRSKKFDDALAHSS